MTPVISATVMTGTNSSEWRQWWRAESTRTGTDWRTLLDQHLDVFNRLRLVKVSS
jgi:hypothetical protein